MKCCRKGQKSFEIRQNYGGVHCSIGNVVLNCRGVIYCSGNVIRDRCGINHDGCGIDRDNRGADRNCRGGNRDCRGGNHNCRDAFSIRRGHIHVVSNAICTDRNVVKQKPDAIYVHPRNISQLSFNSCLCFFNRPLYFSVIRIPSIGG